MTETAMVKVSKTQEVARNVWDILRMCAAAPSTMPEKMVTVARAYWLFHIV